MCGVVIDHVKDNTEACLVEGLHHLLEFLDTCHRIVWIRREGTLDSVIVQRLVAPVVLVVLQAGLVDCREVCRRKELDICHSKFLEMVDTCRKTVRILRTLLSHSKILTLVLHSGVRMNGEIPVLEFIYDDVGRLDLRTLVLCPSLRICLRPVDHRSAHAVHSDSLGSDTLGLFEPCSVLIDLECVECTLDILLHSGLPESVLP